jgi:hypothetical protein
VDILLSSLKGQFEGASVRTTSRRYMVFDGFFNTLEWKLVRA